MSAVSCTSLFSRSSPCLVPPNGGSTRGNQPTASSLRLPRNREGAAQRVETIFTLIRSHSPTRRQDPQPAVHPEPGADLPDHADLQNSSQAPVNMTTQTDDERPSRKLKSENRLYNFLSRSRSRPRTKDAHIPPKSSALASSQDASKPLVSSDSKPPTHIPSRPLSSNTTATNATVTPGTPKARARPIAAIIVSPAGLESQVPSQSMSPNPPSSRKKLHNLFGITLPSPKKSSFGSAASRPSSSRSSLDVPPLPTHTSASNPDPKHKKTFSRGHSPAALAKMRQNGSRLSTSLTDISNAQCAGATTMFHRFFSGSKGTQTTEKPPIAVSGPLRRPSHHKSTNSDSQRPTGKSRYGHEPSNSLPGPSLPPLPHIICTPATPDRRTTLSTSSPSSPPRKSQDSRKISLDSAHRSLKGKEKETSSRQHPDKADIGGFHTITTAVQRGESGFSSLTEWNKHLERIGQERESTFGPGLAGLGTLQREISLKRGKEREEQVRVRDAERRKLFRQQKQKNDQSSPHDTSTVQTDHTGGSASTAGTAQSSSWGRAAGKRSALSGKTASGSGLPKTLVHHPAFDFEPPVPSSSPRGASGTSMLQDTSLTSTERPSDGKRGQKTESKVERPHVLFPAPATIGHRSALKGRSLDLGLGFAWAPSSVREEALLPSLNIGRTFSQSSSVKSANGRSTPSNSTGNAKREAVYENEDGTEEGSKLGKEIGAIFKNTLDHDGFVNFRKYVHQFDAHEIPFDGPTGITTRVEQLLGETSTLKPYEKKQLMDHLVRIILRNA